MNVILPSFPQSEAEAKKKGQSSNPALPCLRLLEKERWVTSEQHMSEQRTFPGIDII
jgi:hypothetical protein